MRAPELQQNQVSAKKGRDAGPFEDLHDWFAKLVLETRPDVVVAIARGAVRVLQLHQIPDAYPHIVFTSDAALPFFRTAELKNRRVLLFDDSLIFGSTLSAINDYLRARGCSVTCAAYVVDRESFFGETPHTATTQNVPSVHAQLQCTFAHKLWRPGVRQHHSLLIERILGTSSHYNLDFPTFRFELPRFDAEDVPELLGLIRQMPSVEEVVDVSSPLSTNLGIYRSSAVFSPKTRMLFCPKQLGAREYSKIRVTVDSVRHEMRITPVPQLMLADGTRFDDVAFDNQHLNSLWHLMEAPSVSDPFYTQALFRLATSFIGTILGHAFALDLCKKLAPRFPVLSVSMVDEDIEAVLGPRNRRHLMTVLSHLRESNTSELVTVPEPKEDRAEEPEDGALSGAVEKLWNRQRTLKPDKHERLCEVLGKVFLSIRLVTDNNSCRKRNPSMSRLERGVSYDGIRALLKGACGIDMSPLDISLAIDASVDQGQAVPKIVRIGQTWLRAFYSGEGEYNQPLLQFKTATYRAYAEYCRQRNVEKLNRFDFHKLCVALKDMLPWLPISTRSYTYGYFVTVGNDEEELVDWLTEGDSSPLSLDRQSGRIQVRKGYRSPVRPTWPPDKESQFFYAFHFTATAFSRIKRDADRAKLLLTTCRTQVDTYEAVACEAHSWIEHARYDFGKFLNEAGALACADGNKPEALNRAVTSLFWSMTYVSEATKKRHIFYEEFARLYSALKKAFVSQGSPAKTFWQCHVEGPGLMDSTRDDGADRQFDMLMKIVFLMAKATNFATRTFMEFDIITYDDLRECFRRHKVDVENNAFAWIIQEPCWDAAASYNRMAQSARAAGLQGISAVLPSERPSGDPSAWVHGALQALGACHAELAAAVREICPRRELLEGQRFQYAWNLLPPSALAEDDRSYQTVFKW